MSFIKVDGKNAFQWKINLNEKLYSGWSQIFSFDGFNFLQVYWNRYLYSSTTRYLYKFQLYSPYTSIVPLSYTFSILDREGLVFVTSRGKLLRGGDPKEWTLTIIDVSYLNIWNLTEESNAFTVRFSVDREQEGANTITAEASNVADSNTNTDSLVTKNNSTNTAEASNVADSNTNTDSLVTKDSSTNTDTGNTSLLETFSSDFASFYENKTDTDCVLKASGSQIHVHRAVLSARSSVFSAMFHHDTVENRTGEVDIPDIKATVLDDVLYYAYSGKIKGLTADTATSMYTAADKYDLLELRTECLEFLKHNLTMDNFCKAALLAHIHGEMELEERVVWFIEEKLDAVIESSNWKQFLKDRTLISSKLLTSALISSKSKVSR